MGKHKKTPTQLGRYLSELRRGRGAGLHGKTRPDRANTERKAVDQDKRDSDA